MSTLAERREVALSVLRERWVYFAVAYNFGPNQRRNQADYWSEDGDGWSVVDLFAEDAKLRGLRRGWNADEDAHARANRYDTTEGPR